MGHVSPAMMRTCSHIRRKALDEAAAALEPSFKLKFPRHKRGLKPALHVDKPKSPKPHETCDRLMSQFTSQWDDLKKEIGWRRTTPPKAGRPSGARARETDSQTRKDPIGFGSSGWTRTSNPPVNRRRERKRR